MTNKKRIRCIKVKLPISEITSDSHGWKFIHDFIIIKIDFYGSTIKKET